MEPAIGTRILYSGHRGTIQYIGPVEGTAGIWLGVEWDDPTRGKHDGCKNSRRYFTCRSLNAGSFIRLSSHLHYGTSFLTAMVSKYVEDMHGSQSQETVLLGSSQGAIEVEAVGLDKIRANLASLENLREISLDGTLVAFGNPADEIHTTCPNVRGLDLSLTLISTWSTVAEICHELPFLERLALNRNRLLSLHAGVLLHPAFPKLTELQLNGTCISWWDTESVLTFMPCLRLLEIGFNGLTSLANNTNTNPATQPVIEVVNFDGNGLDEWVHVCTSLSRFKQLTRIILISNKIEMIPFPQSGQRANFHNIALSHNGLRTWSDVEALSCWCASLQVLSLSGNPLLFEDIAHTRPLIIARLPALKVLDGTPISGKERRDSELFYMSTITNQRRSLTPDNTRGAAPFRWVELCEKYGAPDTIQSINQEEKLSSQLIELTVYRGTKPPASHSPAALGATYLKVLPTMSLRHLKSKLRQRMKVGIKELDCWLRMQDDTWAKLGSDRDSHSLDWFGFETGSQLYITYD